LQAVARLFNEKETKIAYKRRISRIEAKSVTHSPDAVLQDFRVLCLDREINSNFYVPFFPFHRLLSAWFVCQAQNMSVQKVDRGEKYAAFQRFGP
jgi:hypothetical protein